MGDVPYSKQKATEALEFFKSLKHVKSPWHGVPFTILPWEEKIIRDVFGTVRLDGTRQYQVVYIEVPKKQGKSELAAGFALQGLCADGEWGAEVYGCAGDRQQASIVFDTAVEMVDQDEELKQLIIPRLSSKRLIYKPTNSFYQVLSHEAFTKHGLNVSRCVFDELHAQPKRDLWDVMLKGSGAARLQPLWVVITTAGDDPDRVSIGWEIHEKARRIRDGLTHNPRWYVTIYGANDYPDIEKRIETMTPAELKKLFRETNPSLGHTTKLEEMMATWREAETPKDKRDFLQFRLNVWVTSAAVSGWLPLEDWDATAGSVYPQKLKGRECYGGLDLSSKRDITAFILLFPPIPEDPHWYVLPRFWIPEEGIQKAEERDHVPYRSRWVPEGWVKATPGSAIDYEVVKNDIIQLSKEYHILEIGADQWNVQKIGSELEDEGLTVVIVDQTLKAFSPVMKELEVLIEQKLLVHGGNPVLRWMFNNTQIKKDDNENIRPTKKIKTGRVDGIFALIDAAARAFVRDEGNPYEDGIIVGWI